jgi:hypothetical protein
MRIAEEKRVEALAVLLMYIYPTMNTLVVSRPHFDQRARLPCRTVIPF